ncbi:uncharacterized protein BDZ99DRAFT_463956 [Mytilinidion resinicola]|uniref:Uncharacterized protein n=1 Tax=Mytilinidion resinicola TaxID=574789 RepID=A0A6A6YK14_9PEZI|nr:uncharacterized protein BDZ99DRAFT_463956 [Mytilinidion resinicola]KAF2809151.1 hypothetical protein BDZ99DRAFT_463956 [Mytilinidion resinicola]
MQRRLREPAQEKAWIRGFLRNTRNLESLSLEIESDTDLYSMLEGAQIPSLKSLTLGGPASLHKLSEWMDNRASLPALQCLRVSKLRKINQNNKGVYEYGTRVVYSSNQAADMRLEAWEIELNEEQANFLSFHSTRQLRNKVLGGGGNALEQAREETDYVEVEW